MMMMSLSRKCDKCRTGFGESRTVPGRRLRRRLLGRMRLGHPLPQCLMSLSWQRLGLMRLGLVRLGCLLPLQSRCGHRVAVAGSPSGVDKCRTGPGRRRRRRLLRMRLRCLLPSRCGSLLLLSPRHRVAVAGSPSRRGRCRSSTRRRWRVGRRDRSGCRRRCGGREEASLSWSEGSRGCVTGTLW